MQCCPKSIKTTLHRIFSFAMLSGTTQITLHRILTYPMLSQEYSYAMLSGPLRQNSIGFRPIQKYFFLCNVIWNHSDRISTYAMLFQEY